jgi:hypothetical protein
MRTTRSRTSRSQHANVAFGGANVAFGGANVTFEQADVAFVSFCNKKASYADEIWGT